MSNYDVIIIGAGPGGIFAAYELAEKAPELKVAVEQEHFQMENTISQIILVEHCMSISVKRQQSI